ncbi:MAG: hypothetical protein AAB655_01050 [Patescibacteria group bacterium]
MYNFFKKHPDIVLMVSAILFLTILFVYFFWGIRILLGSLGKTIGITKATEKITTFDLKGAERLDLKGLVR